MNIIKITPEGKIALAGSIQKWESIANAFIQAGETGADPAYSEQGIEDCPLCQEFYSPTAASDYKRCGFCPIKEDTGKPGCQRTPYDAWCDTDDAYTCSDEYETLENAQAMWDYLVDLDKRVVVLKADDAEITGLSG